MFAGLAAPVAGRRLDLAEEINESPRGERFPPTLTPPRKLGRQAGSVGLGFAKMVISPPRMALS